MAHGKFGTAINCMDGRTQLPVNQWMKDNFALDHVDTVTEPGPDGILAFGKPLVDSIKSRVLISVNAHHSRVIAVVGHCECAGNPVTKEEHSTHLKKAVQVVRSWNLPVTEVVGLWVGEDWKPEVIVRI